MDSKMKFPHALNDRDRRLINSQLKDFAPAEIFDFHVHPCEPSHFGPEAWKNLQPLGTLGCAEHRAGLQAIADLFLHNARRILASTRERSAMA